jgi:pyridinium-3,5-biscarboxylic acid mononucleotide synthase
MNLRTILEQFANGEINIEEVQRQISINYMELLENGLAKLDVSREFRKGVPEVIFAEHKEYKDLVQIVLAELKLKGQVIISRIRRKDLPKLCSMLRRYEKIEIEVGKRSTTLLATNTSVQLSRPRKNNPKIGILTAGTADVGVAEEARLVAKAMGCEVMVNYDVGIAGIHRLFPAIVDMIKENVIVVIVVAGMEGALASVVSSIVDVPVIGVPTSVGYGFGSKGLAALSSMLQSCAFGLAVVNIDNGIGAGAFAATVANKIALKKFNTEKNVKN